MKGEHKEKGIRKGDTRWNWIKKVDKYFPGEVGLRLSEGGVRQKKKWYTRIRALFF